MPLTRSQMAEMGEVKDPQVDQGSEEEFGSVQDESTGEQNPELRKMLLAQQHELRVREMEIRRKERAEISQAEADAKKRGMDMRIKQMELKLQIRMVQLELKFLNKFINNLSVEEMSKKEKYEAQARQSEQDLEKYNQQKDIKLKEIRDKTEEKVKEIKARAEEEILQIRAEFEAKQKELEKKPKEGTQVKAQQNLNYSEENMRETWDPKYSKGLVQSPPKMGGHFVDKTSGQSQSRNQILEGKPKQDEKDSKYTRKCYFCQGKGHLISECEKLKQLKGIVPQDSSGTKPKAVFCVQKEQGSLSLREPVAMATQSGTATSADQAEENGPLVEVRRCLLVRTDSQLFETAGVDVGILGHQYRGLRDTCSQVTLCHPDIIPREYVIPNESMKVAGIEGQVISLPVAEVPVNFQGWRGVWRLAISSTLPAAVLVGNDLAEHVKRVLVITRSQATTGTVQGGNDEPETEAEGSSEAVVETLTTDSRFGQEQKADATLQKCFEQVTDAQLTPETPVRFLEKKGILYRETLRNISKGGDGIRSQLVVPEKYRPMILQRGHSDMFAAHLGVNKTQQRITQNFYWPDIGKQIREFCKQCDVCQRQGNSRDRTKAKLCPLPVIDTPFKCIGVDIVGPLPKATKRGNRFILTIVDHATRYPEAIPLTNIETNTVADALVGYMSRMGFASEIITDLGASFTSKLMKRLWQICGIKHKETTAYHPESNGLTEKFNGTLMRMIRAYLAENPNNWDQKLQSLLFAYRSVPQASTGFSPFELLFGRRVKGPLDLIKQNWEQITQDDPQDVVTYIDTLMNDLKKNLELAAETLQAQKVRKKAWDDQEGRERHFNPGEGVLWPRLCKENKLQLGIPETKYLGHMVGGGVIKPLEAKIEAVRDWPRPNTKKKVKSFLGLVGYYRKFIPRFSKIAAPLTNLTRKKADDRIPWTSDCEEAFQRLKQALINYPVLRAPDFDREFIIYTDASNSGVGAVLCQEDENGDQHPVSYLSRKLQKGERHLATMEKECLAIVYAIQKAKPYIWGRHFVLCTDHSPLQWLKTMKTHNSKLMRWALNLQDYDFEVKVVRGSVNCVADALSRRPEE
ncbi:uncharacterized protein LOC144587040 [Pogona vitticeps]